MNRFDRLTFAYQVMELLPLQWRINFRAYEALEFYDIEDYVSMTYTRLDKEQLDKIMKLCIKTVNPEIPHYKDGTPYAVLTTIIAQKQANDGIARRLRYKEGVNQLRIQQSLDKGKFNGEMYYLARSKECKDPEYILNLFCNKPANKIQRAWKKYIGNKRNKSARIIQQKVLEWLYRPGGPIAKKAEAHFIYLASK